MATMLAIGMQQYGSAEVLECLELPVPALPADTLPLEQAQEARHTMETKRTRGKLVLVVDQADASWTGMDGQAN